VTIRAVTIGLALGLLVSAFNYFNDAVIKQTMFIGNFLPISIFGALLVLLLMANPMLRWLGVRWPLRAGELALIAAIGLAACGWPGSNGFRVFATNLAMPAHWLKTNPSWQSAGVMSYLPGGSAEIAEGQVGDYTALAGALQDPPAGSVAAEVRQALPEATRFAVDRLEAGRMLGPSDRRRLLTGLNAVIREGAAEKPPWAADQTDASETLPAGEDFELVEAEAGLPDFYQSLPESALLEEAKDLRQTVDDDLAEAEAYLQQARAATGRRQKAVDTWGEEHERLLAERSEIAQPLQELNNRISELNGEREEIKRRIEGLRRDASAPGQTARQIDELTAKAAAISDQIDRLEAEAAPLREDLTEIDGRLGELEQALHEHDNAITVNEGMARYYWEEAKRAAARINRWVMAANLPGEILPPPKGEGVLLAGGATDKLAVEGLVGSGWDGKLPLGLDQLPWRIWWPTLRLWGGMAIIVSLLAVCMVLVVHPQWSRRELLAYPIARFVSEAVEPGPRGWLPQVARSRLFWYAGLFVAAIHLVNGIHAWNPEFIEIPLQFDFNPVRQLFPNASQVRGGWGIFHPRLYPTVIAFAFFLATDVSFSLGISGFLWLAFGALLIANGVPLEAEYLGAKKLNLMLFGSYFGMALIVLYVGRRYYLNVALGAIGLRQAGDTPRYAAWGARFFVVLFVVGVVLLKSAGLPWFFGTALIALICLMMLVITRINAETGLFFIQAWWMPVGMLTALFGIEAIGPTNYLIMAVACVVLVGDPREIIMPFIANGVRMTDRDGDRPTPPSRVAPWLAATAVIGFVVALGATFYFQYNMGVNSRDGWATRILPSMPLNELTRHLSELSAHNMLHESASLSGLERLAYLSTDWATVGWIGFGLGLVLVTAFARLRLPWWPLHPVLFLFWGTYPFSQFVVSFLIGWAIKAAVVKLVGAKGYHSVKPLMVGIIAGEILIGLAFIVYGLIYYNVTGQTPASYGVFPG